MTKSFRMHVISAFMTHLNPFYAKNLVIYSFSKKKSAHFRQFCKCCWIAYINEQHDSTGGDSIFRYEYTVFHVRAHNQMNGHELIIILLIINATNCFSHKFIKHFIQWFEQLDIPVCMCAHECYEIHWNGEREKCETSDCKWYWTIRKPTNQI